MTIDRHMAVPEAYEGREQSYVKHFALRSYLEKLFLIIGTSSARLRISEICYVDCFAGPWKAETTTLEDTSIGISLRTLDACQQQLNRRGNPLSIRALYIEKDPSRYAQLESFLDRRGTIGVKGECFHGDFTAMQDRILNWCGNNSFSFFFIDPTGWKDIKISCLKPLLMRPRSEFLITFMYDFINRTASMPDWKDPIAELIGASLELDGLDANEREDQLIGAYRSSLKSETIGFGRLRPRSARVRVLDPGKERPKFHLVYLTTHPRGIIEFMQVSESTDLVQKHVQVSKKVASQAARNRMNDMFAEEIHINADTDGANIYWVRQFWLSSLSIKPKRFDEAEFASLLEKTDWFPGDLQRALKMLIDEGKVINLDAKRNRPKKPLHWEDGGERLALVEEVK